MKNHVSHELLRSQWVTLPLLSVGHVAYQQIADLNGCSHSFRKSTLPSCINVWNSLPVNIKNCKSVLSLKNKINEQPLSQFSKFPLLTKMKVPRDLEIILFKCRSGLLTNVDKFRHNFKDVSPSCACGYLQMYSHLFFSCITYANQRFILFDKIYKHKNCQCHTLTEKTNLLLYGSCNLTIDDKFLLSIVGSFLKTIFVVNLIRIMGQIS